MTRLSTIEDALEALRAGRPVLVTDDEDRENEGDVIMAAQTLTDEWMAWTIRHSSGYVCAPMPDAIADRLDLPLMVSENADWLVYEIAVVDLSFFDGQTATSTDRAPNGGQVSGLLGSWRRVAR